MSLTDAFDKSEVVKPLCIYVYLSEVVYDKESIPNSRSMLNFALETQERILHLHLYNLHFLSIIRIYFKTLALNGQSRRALE
jgi:hypothetical protein